VTTRPRITRAASAAREVIGTARLTLRRLRPGDAPFMLDLLNEPAFIRHIGDRGVRTVEDAAAYIARGPVASYARYGFGLLLVELTGSGAPLGICGVLKRDELPDPDIGFAFLARHWSQGYALEAAAAISRYARDVLGLPRLLAIVHPDNAPSIRLLEKLGFAFSSNTRLTADAHEVKLYSCSFDA
jgi:[ribosomal protein S5]-alanine N-acetyltransferase